MFTAVSDEEAIAVAFGLLGIYILCNSVNFKLQGGIKIVRLERGTEVQVYPQSRRWFRILKRLMR